MKKWILLIIAMISMVVISACSDKNIVTKTPTEEEPDKETLGDTYGFTTFDLAIDTKEMKQTLIANYEEKPDKIEALYENKAEDAYLHGNKAMDKLDSIFEDLALEPDVDAEDMIKKVSEAFEIVDYTTLKLTIKFKGHDIKDLMMSK